MTYRAQNDTSFSRYERMQSGSPFPWRVRTTDGKVMIFGRYSQMTDCAGVDHYAPLTNVIDSFGNEIRYEYKEVLPNECDLVSITWGKNTNAGLADFASVELIYKSDSCNGVFVNSQTDYRSGVAHMTGGARLDTILARAYTPGSPSSVVHTRAIELRYDGTAATCNQQHAPVRLLTSIQESAWGTDSPRVDLPELTFEYNSPTVELGSPEAGNTPWLEPKNLGWGFRRNDDRWPTVETMFLDVDGDGLQDLLVDNARDGEDITNCSAEWRKNLGTGSDGHVHFGYGGTIDLPRLKWRGVDPQPSNGSDRADRSSVSREGCALNGQVTAFENSYLNSNFCHDPLNPTCKPATNPLNPLQYCFPGGTDCPPDAGGVAKGRFRTYLAYRWLDMDSDGLPDLVTSVQGDIDFYDIERGNKPGYEDGEPSISGIPGVGKWPACKPANDGDRCYELVDCFNHDAIRTCNESGCSIDWSTVVECVTTSVTTGCQTLMEKPASGPDGMPSYGVKRAPYERCEGLYPWLIYKNLGKGEFAVKPDVKYQPVPLESSSGDSSFNGPRVTSESHAVLDFDGDGWLDAVVRATEETSPGSFLGTNAWQVWLGDGTGGFEPKNYIFPTRDWNCPSPCPSFGDNAISGIAGVWGHPVASKVGLLDVNGDGAQDHWLAPYTAGGTDIAFNDGEKLRLIGPTAHGEVTTALINGGTESVRPGNDIFVNITAPSPFINQPIEEGTTTTHNRIVDVDHDGRLDVVWFVTPTDAPVVFFNLGGQFTSTGVSYPGDLNGITRLTSATATLGVYEDFQWSLNADLLDLDGDGISEGVYFDKNQAFHVAKPRDTQPPRLLRAVHNGRGAHSFISYAQMHDKDVVDQHPEETWFDSRPKASPRAQWVVSSLEAKDDLSSTDGTTQYTYKNPRFAPDDKGHYGFRGFEEVTTTKPGPTGAANGARTVQRYGYDVDWSGRLVQTIAYMDDRPTEARTIDTTSWQALPLFGGYVTTYHPLVTQHYVCSNGQTESGCTATPAAFNQTTSTFTSYPLLQVPQMWVESKSLLQAGHTPAPGDRQTLTTYTLVSNANQYLLRESDVERQHYLAGSMVTFAKSRKTWDTTNGGQLTDEVWFDSVDANRAITRYAFDPQTGNRTATWKPVQWAANPDITTNLNKTTLAYDSRALFVATETNEKGHVRNYVYEYGTGTKLDTLGPNTSPCAPSCGAGQPTREDHRIRVDGLGRMIERFETFAAPGENFVSFKVETNSYVDGPAASVTHESAIDNDVSLAVRYSRDKTELDGRGRPLKKTVYVFGSAHDNQVTTYRYDKGAALSQHVSTGAVSIT